MQTFDKLIEIPNLTLALGYFDGVHLGHQKVIKSAVNYAKENNTKSAVVTFKDHPCCYFYGVCPKYILQREVRRKRIEDLGVDYLFELDFDENLSKLNAEDYLNNILVKYFKPVSISTGFNHFFGAKKTGDAEFLNRNQEKYGYRYFDIPPQKHKDKVISSTLIRELLSLGNIDSANEMLGINFEVTGKVIGGQKLGRKLGFRTANVLYPPELIDLPFGVYEVISQYGKGIANFGIRPTVSDTKKAILETHILDFDGDIYGQNIDIEFMRMLRKERKFSSVEELKIQINKDIKSVI